jgi:hypothetical protein
MNYFLELGVLAIGGTVTNSGEVIRSIKEDTEDQRYWKS